jgi:hypothetical protein
MPLCAAQASNVALDTLSRCVVIGHSHGVAIQNAARKRALEGPQFLNMHEPQWATALNGSDPSAIELLRAAPAIFSCIGGNDHNILGLLDHPRPFDFVLPREPSLPLRGDGELVPVAIVRAAIEQFIRPRLAELATLRQIAPSGVLFHLESPPPIPSGEHVARHPGIFREQIEQEARVAPRLLRYKLWRVHGELFEDACRDHDVTVIPAPAATRDPEGFLGEPFWNPDPTHGNVAYGEQVLRQIIDVLGEMS